MKEIYCYSLLKTNGQIIAVIFGKDGYRESDIIGKFTQETVDEMNAALGIDKATAEAMTICSMFGTWEKFENIRATLAEKIQ